MHAYLGERTVVSSGNSVKRLVGMPDIVDEEISMFSASVNLLNTATIELDILYKECVKLQFHMDVFERGTHILLIRGWCHSDGVYSQPGRWARSVTILLIHVLTEHVQETHIGGTCI